jgi:hypothetical protein
MRRRIQRRWITARHARGEQGFALLATLVIIGVTSVLVLAMLGLSLSTSKYSTAQVERDGRTRAADSAIDSAINVLVRETDTTGRVDATDPCVLAQEDADGLPTMRIDGEDVVVTCTPQTPDAPPAPLTGEPPFEQVRVVGTDYANDDVDSVNPTAPEVAAAMAPLGGAAATAADAYASNGATIVHEAPGALTFSSDVTVRKGAAAFRNPATAGGRTFGPAMAVSGLYFQGDSGLSDTNQANTRDCGAQSRWNEPAAKSVWIRTIRIDPTCGSTSAAALTGDSADLDAPTPWPGNALDTPRSLPACSGSVIVIQPGVYGPAQTATLNQWFSTATCNSKTFLFRSGEYLFDVASPGALIFDDPTSNIVFGDPDQWNPEEQPSAAAVAAFFPQACALNEDGIDGRNTGVAITLSSRTVMRHESGRVAICDRRTSNDPVTAIWQTSTLTPDWGPVSPVGVTSPPTSPSGDPRQVEFTNATGINAAGGTAARVSASCDRTFLLAIFGLRECERTTRGTLNIASFSQAVPATASPIDSLRLTISGSSRNVSNAGGRFIVRIAGAGIPTGSCQVVSNSTSSVSRTFEVLDEAIGDCASKIDDIRDLAGATVSMSYDFAPLCRVAVGIFSGYNYDSNICRASDLPYLEVDAVTLTARSELNRGDIAADSEWLVTSDARPADPINSTSFNVFGRVSIPRADLEIRWDGAPTSEPIFGGTLVVKGIGSSGPTNVTAGGAFVSTPGIVCCVLASPSERVVVINAWTDVSEKAGGGFEGRLSATARVAVEDYRIGVSGQPEFSPGNRVRVETWQLCDSPIADFPGVVPNPALAAPVCRTV